jgi:phosphopantothenoylcysteine synthetase/decarboxylase
MAAPPRSETRNPKCVVLGVTGSIAAYKSAELASLLVKQAHDVFVVMTRDAVEFITPLTLQTLSKISHHQLL